MFMVMLVLDDCNCLDAVLDAWDQIGIDGVTIIESTGIQRRRTLRARIPLRFDFEGLLHPGEEGHYTLLAIVADEELVQRGLAAAETVLGDLDGPHTGVMAAWPLTLAKGVPAAPAEKERA